VALRKLQQNIGQLTQLKKQFPSIEVIQKTLATINEMPNAIAAKTIKSANELANTDVTKLIELNNLKAQAIRSRIEIAVADLGDLKELIPEDQLNGLGKKLTERLLVTNALLVVQDVEVLATQEEIDPKTAVQKAREFLTKNSAALPGGIGQTLKAKLDNAERQVTDKQRLKVETSQIVDALLEKTTLASTGGLGAVASSDSAKNAAQTKSLRAQQAAQKRAPQQQQKKKR